MCKQVSDYVNYRCKQYVGLLSINVLSAECSIHVVTKMLSSQKVE